jgi:hypothetical protein
MVFLAPKTLLYPLSTWKKLFFPNLNLMILQMVWNECVSFGGHVDIQVSYKILRLGSTKESPNFAQSILLSRRTQYNLRYLGVKITRRKPHLKWCYNVLLCTFYVYIDACIKIDTISNLCACLFGQQLTKYSS